MLNDPGSNPSTHPKCQSDILCGNVNVDVTPNQTAEYVNDPPEIF